MNDIDPAKFERARQNAEASYKAIDKIRCPFFNEDVAFNAKGLEHIKFTRIRQARPHRDQYIRFRLVALAPKIIQQSHTLQGVSMRNNLERMKINSRWDTIMRPVTYYEFVAVVKDVRVRVIIKQVEGGQKYFWSIIPFWKMDKITGRKILYSGKPETD